MAWSAFRTRLRKACLSCSPWPRMPISSPRSTATSTLLRAACCLVRSSTSPMTCCKTKRPCSTGSGRAKRRKSSSTRLRRSTSLIRMPANSCFGSSAATPSRRISAVPLIEPSGLRISWAIPAESSPSAESRSARRNCSSISMIWSACSLSFW